MVILFVEIESLRSRLNIREHEINILRKNNYGTYLKKI
jgi:hypothetical protein